jgi:hypothetical protein
MKLAADDVEGMAIPECGLPHARGQERRASRALSHEKGETTCLSRPAVVGLTDPSVRTR